MPYYFITGTDTGVGKTVVGCAITAAMTARGKRCAVMKPVETGVETEPPDATALWHAAGNSAPLPPEVCPYQFPLAAAPDVAATSSGQTISRSHINQTWNSLRKDTDFGIVEGAGGWLVPFGSDWFTCELVNILQLPVLIVARAGLGTINHTLLTAESAKQRGASIAGFILNGARDSTTSSNAELIARYSHVPLLGILPRLGHLDPASLALAAEEHLDMEALATPPKQMNPSA